jgi:uncharacterized protein YigE (DUF2233 family)
VRRGKITACALCAAALLLAAPLSSAVEKDCHAVKRNVGGGRWQGLSPGLEVRDYRFLFTDESFVRMTAVRVGLEVFRVRLRWLANSAPKVSTAEALGQDVQIGVLANAGYFDENGRPLGFFLSGGKTYNRRLLFRGKKLALHLGAVFSVRAGTEKVGIATREEFDLGAEAEAFQAGPLLVRGGMPTAGLESYREFRRPDRRTVIALERSGRLLVLVSEKTRGGISWCELQVVLSRPESEGGLGVEAAMNLDGGRSSQLFIRSGAYRRNVPGRKIPAMIVITPRGVN